MRVDLAHTIGALQSRQVASNGLRFGSSDMATGYEEGVTLGGRAAGRFLRVLPGATAAHLPQLHLTSRRLREGVDVSRSQTVRAILPAGGVERSRERAEAPSRRRHDMGTLRDSALRRWGFKLLVNLYGPYVLSGVRITEVADDLRCIEVRMALRPWNRNYVGTHFGGSLFAMADPWFMIMLIEQLGPGYVVWDKSGSIRFRKPGRGTVRARFELAQERVEEIRRAADDTGKTEPVFTAQIVDAQGEVVAEVEKLLSVRRRT